MASIPGRWLLTQAVASLYRGQIIAYPTEAVWGLGCDPFNVSAVNRLLAIKNRPIEKGLILVAANLQQIAPLLYPLNEKQRAQLMESVEVSTDDKNLGFQNQRATTWLIPSQGLVPQWITGDHDTVAIRISRHPVVNALCLAFGGMIVSTSANPRSLRPAVNQLAARRYFGKRIDTYVTGTVGSATQPSIIRDLTTGRVLR